MSVAEDKDNIQEEVIMEAAENPDGNINGFTLAIVIFIILQVVLVVILVLACNFRSNRKNPDIGFNVSFKFNLIQI